MAWRDLPDEVGGADLPLCSWLTNQVELNLDVCHEQSRVDRCLHADGAKWELAVGYASTWRSFAAHGDPAWKEMPIPIRYKRTGAFRDISIQVTVAATVADVSLRAYLLPTRGLHSGALSSTDCITYTSAYDGITVTGGAGTTVATFADITPELTETLHAGSSFISIPYVWLHFFAYSSNAGATLMLYSVRYREVL